MKKTNSKKPGFVVLMGVLILGIVLTLLLPALILISTDNYRVSDSVGKSNQALVQAESCAELALSSLQTNQSYAGNETKTLSTGTCFIQTITGAGQVRTIQTQSTVDNHTKRIRVITSQLTPQILISSWVEI